MSRASLQDFVNPKPLMVGIAGEHPRQEHIPIFFGTEEMALKA
jgi:hypothetical protein